MTTSTNHSPQSPTKPHDNNSSSGNRPALSYRSYRQWIFFARGYIQGLFFACTSIGLIIFGPSKLIEKSSWDSLLDFASVLFLTLGVYIRFWALSYVGKHTRSRKLKAPRLIQSGAYACIRNPIYAGNFLIGLGFTLLAEQLPLIVIYPILFVLSYHYIVSAEEQFLLQRFGDEYLRYCNKVPRRYFPHFSNLLYAKKFGTDSSRKEIGTLLGVLVGAISLEWLEVADLIHRYAAVVREVLLTMGIL